MHATVCVNYCLSSQKLNCCIINGKMTSKFNLVGEIFIDKQGRLDLNLLKGVGLLMFSSKGLTKYD